MYTILSILNKNKHVFTPENVKTEKKTMIKGFTILCFDTSPYLSIYLFTSITIYLYHHLFIHQYLYEIDVMRRFYSLFRYFLHFLLSIYLNNSSSIESAVMFDLSKSVS